MKYNEIQEDVEHGCDLFRIASDEERKKLKPVLDKLVKVLAETKEKEGK